MQEDQTADDVIACDTVGPEDSLTTPVNAQQTLSNRQSRQKKGISKVDASCQVYSLSTNQSLPMQYRSYAICIVVQLIVASFNTDLSQGVLR